jgi:hypothetical protein
MAMMTLIMCFGSAVKRILSFSQKNLKKFLRHISLMGIIGLPLPLMLER